MIASELTVLPIATSIETFKLFVTIKSATGLTNASTATVRRMAGRKLISTGELAGELGISPRTVARYVRGGLLEPTETTLGGHYRWNLDDVREQIKKLRAESADE